FEKYRRHVLGVVVMPFERTRDIVRGCCLCAKGRKSVETQQEKCKAHTPSLPKTWAALCGTQSSTATRAKHRRQRGWLLARRRGPRESPQARCCKNYAGRSSPR